MALNQADVDAKEAEFKFTSFFELPKAERWEIIRHLQNRYQSSVAVASREALKAEAAARLARPRQKNKKTSARAPRGAASTMNLPR
jgi:hypothetical protein